MGRRARIGKIGKWTEAGVCGQAAGVCGQAAGVCGQATGVCGQAAAVCSQVAAVHGWLLPLRITACCRLVSGIKL